MTGFSLSLPDGLKSMLDEEARLAGMTRSAVARVAIAEHLARKERERYIAAFLTEARAAYANPRIRKDALAIAEEALH